MGVGWWRGISTFLCFRVLVRLRGNALLETIFSAGWRYRVTVSIACTVLLLRRFVVMIVSLVIYRFYSGIIPISMLAEITALMILPPNNIIL